MLADRPKRKPDAHAASDCIRDNAEAERRDLIVVNATETPRKGKRSRYADTLFLAHVFAAKFDVPQHRVKRRAEPADANASYRKNVNRPVRSGRVLSKKV